MNNITQMLAEKLGYVNDDGEIEQDGPKGRKTLGPENFRTMTSGQVRRAGARRAATQRRKTTKRYRIGWIHNQFQIAILRGNLQALGLVAYHPQGPKAHFKVDPESRAYIRANRFLEDRYGSVAEALTQYNKIVVERRMQASA